MASTGHGNRDAHDDVDDCLTDDEAASLLSEDDEEDDKENEPLHEGVLLLASLQLSL